MTGTPNDAVFVVKRSLSYREGVELQRSILASMAADPGLPAHIILAEHLPVVTCGRTGDGSNLLVAPAELAARGIEYHPAGRGGDVTYHGPGQWTVYPLVRLAWYGKDLHRYLRLLEECAIRFLAAYGVGGGRRPGLTGAWVGDGKVAAVGVAVSRWISWHGFALNICPDLSCFTGFMHPCGIRANQGAVASLESLTGGGHTLESTEPVLRRTLLDVLNLTERES